MFSSFDQAKEAIRVLFRRRFPRLLKWVGKFHQKDPDRYQTLKHFEITLILPEKQRGQIDQSRAATYYIQRGQPLFCRLMMLLARARGRELHQSLAIYCLYFKVKACANLTQCGRCTEKLVHYGRFQDSFVRSGGHDFAPTKRQSMGKPRHNLFNMVCNEDNGGRAI